MNEQNKAKIEKWEADIRELENKVKEIKQEDLDILYKENEKVLGRCFQKKKTYMKIMSSYEDKLFCNEINFDLINLSAIASVGFHSLKEIEGEGYVELSLKVFDERIKIEMQDFGKGFFQVEEQK